MRSIPENRKESESLEKGATLGLFRAIIADLSIAVVGEAPSEQREQALKRVVAMRDQLEDAADRILIIELVERLRPLFKDKDSKSWLASILSL